MAQVPAHHCPGLEGCVSPPVWPIVSVGEGEGEGGVYETVDHREIDTLQLAHHYPSTLSFSFAGTQL